MTDLGADNVGYGGSGLVSYHWWVSPASGTLAAGPWHRFRFIGRQGQSVLGLVLAHWYSKPGYKVPEYRALGFLEWMLA